jgi:stearoyl-CoA desaturase (delta-9 desaturase)
LFAIVFGGVFFYREAAADRETLTKYGRGCPDDWAERNIFTRNRMLGLMIMACIDLMLFGLPWGVVVFSAMAVWIPIFGNVINGIGHAIGDRNFETKDASRNIIPVGLWIVGEELHNNHHADPRSASFRAKWYEFDIGWIYIKLLSWVKLAQVIYARKLTAKEFAAKYYDKAAEAAASARASAQATASAAMAAASEAAESAAEKAREALTQQKPALE